MSHNFAVTIITVSVHGQQACVSNTHFTSIGREAFVQDYLEENLQRTDVDYILVFKTNSDKPKQVGVLKKYTHDTHFTKGIETKVTRIVKVEIAADKFMIEA